MSVEFPHSTDMSAEAKVFPLYFSRLNDPTQCPANGSRREDCDCRRDYTAAGMTTFSKVRLDLRQMDVISEWPTHPELMFTLRYTQSGLSF